MLDSLFNKVAGLQINNAKFLRTAFRTPPVVTSESGTSLSIFLSEPGLKPIKICVNFHITSQNLYTKNVQLRLKYFREWYVLKVWLLLSL